MGVSLLSFAVSATVPSFIDRLCAQTEPQGDGDHGTHMSSEQKQQGATCAAQLVTFMTYQLVHA